MFDVLNFYYFPDLPNVASYISTKRCVGGLTITNLTGGCVPGQSLPGDDYIFCTGQGPGYDWLVHYILPPFEIKRACDENPKCIAFTIESGGTTGNLYTGTPRPTLPNGTMLPNFVGTSVKWAPSVKAALVDVSHASSDDVRSHSPSISLLDGPFIVYPDFDLSRSWVVGVGGPIKMILQVLNVRLGMAHRPGLGTLGLLETLVWDS